MRAFNAGLGVECEFCHEPPDFAKDTEQKERARHMIEIVQDLNSTAFTWPNAPRATCFMCHRGHESLNLSHRRKNPIIRSVPTLPFPSGCHFTACLFVTLFRRHGESEREP